MARTARIDAVPVTGNADADKLAGTVTSFDAEQSKSEDAVGALEQGVDSESPPSIVRQRLARFGRFAEEVVDLHISRRSPRQASRSLAIARNLADAHAVATGGKGHGSTWSPSSAMPPVTGEDDALCK